MKQLSIILIAFLLLYLIAKSDLLKGNESKEDIAKKYAMKIKIIRDTFTEKSTIGKMYIDGIYFCDTLEDKVRPVKIKHITAIPAGKYDTIVNMSTRFKKLMPRLQNVPNFDGVLIHNGNTAENTDGCILLGVRSGKDFVGSSVNTFNSFMKVVNAYLKNNPLAKIETTIS